MVNLFLYCEPEVGAKLEVGVGEHLGVDTGTW